MYKYKYKYKETKVPQTPPLSVFEYLIKPLLSTKVSISNPINYITNNKLVIIKMIDTLYQFNILQLKNSTIIIIFCL